MTGEGGGRKRRPGSSARWLRRQATDPHARAARQAGLRSRAAFKLDAIATRWKLLKPGLRVVDLGAAPGGWVQIAAARVAPGGVVVGIDLKSIAPIQGAILLVGDAVLPASLDRIRAALGGPADLVLSDMAPGTTGHAETDHLRGLGLAEAALELAGQLLRPGGNFLVKLRQGSGEPGFFQDLRRQFRQVERVKPPASRAELAELYHLAIGWQGPPA